MPEHLYDDEVSMQDLVDALVDARTTIEGLYIGNDSFVGAPFKEWRTLQTCGGPEARLEYATEVGVEDDDGEAVQTVHYAVSAEVLVPLYAKVPPTGRAGRPSNVKQPVDSALHLAVCAHVKQTAAAGAANLVAELHRRFPTCAELEVCPYC